MKKKILCISLCMLLITTALPAVGTISELKTVKETSYRNNYLINHIAEGSFNLGGWTEQGKLIASDGFIEDFFGYSVSVDGEYAVIGTPGHPFGFGGWGYAYVFKYNGMEWVEQDKLIASDGANGDVFGYSVSICGDYIIVGAPFDDDFGYSSGSAYIFKRDGINWVQQSKLLALDGADGDFFGLSVSIDGDYAIIGAVYNENNEVVTGSAYVFKYDNETWIQQDKLIASDGSSEDNFGGSVSISGDYAIIGSVGDDDNGENSGSAYVFKRNDTIWIEEAKLIPSDGVEWDLFSRSVSIYGDYIVIGAPYKDAIGDYSGAAYIFKRNGSFWVEEDKLIASDGSSYYVFGWSVSIHDECVIIGSPGDTQNGIDSGSAYIFNKDGDFWIEDAKLLASDGTYYDYFGGSVSIDEDYVIMGAYGDDDNGDFSGASYIFKNTNLSDLDCSDSLIWNDINPGETVMGTITIENIGGLGSLLDWKILSYPEWGHWLFDPESGTGLGEGESFKIDVTIEAPNEEETTFTGEIIFINIKNPDDVCTIDVSLTTPVIHKITLFSIFKNIFEHFPIVFTLLRRLI